MRYSEAIIRGAKTAQATTEKSLQETLQTVSTRRCKNRNKETEMRGKRPRKGQNRWQEAKKTVLNLSSRRLTDDDLILLGKGLSFCPKSKGHDKIKLAEELFKYTRRIRLKEFI